MYKRIVFAALLGILLASTTVYADTQPQPTATGETTAAAPVIVPAAAPAAAPAVDTKDTADVKADVSKKTEAKADEKADEKAAVAPTVNPEDPGAILKLILQAVKEARWAWLAGLILMLLTFLFNKILQDKIPKKVLPWVAIGLGVATNVAMSFASGMHWLEAIGNGVTLGLTAAGGWSAIGKLILGKKDGVT